jgi:hypothetical protein
MLNFDDFKRAIQAIDALGATPAVLLKVTALAKDPNTDLETIGALLRNDGPLAADIIRIISQQFNFSNQLHWVAGSHSSGQPEPVPADLRPRLAQLWCLSR